MTLIRFRSHRSILVMMVVVLMPSVGAAWALSHDAVALAIAGIVTVITILIVVFEEAIGTSVDRELERLYKTVEEQRRELNALSESVREEDRIVGLLEERNTALAAELVARAVHPDAA